MVSLVCGIAGRPKNGPTPKRKKTSITSGTMVAMRSRFTPKRPTTTRMSMMVPMPVTMAETTPGTGGTVAQPLHPETSHHDQDEHDGANAGDNGRDDHPHRRHATGRTEDEPR